MVKSAIADDSLLVYLTSISKQNTCAVGLILGQSCLGKDYVIHFAKTPTFHPEELKKENLPPKQLKTISDVNEGWVADHARHATRMLPGGMYVLGIFIISPDDLLTPFNSKIKSILLTIHKQLEQNKYLHGNADCEKIVLNYSIKKQKYFSKTYDVNTSNVQPADFKFLPKSTKWTNVECKFDIDQIHYLKTNEADWPLQKHMKVILDEIYYNLDNAIFLFDCESKHGEECLENVGKKKKVPRSSNKTHEDIQDNKSMQVSIFLPPVSHSSKDSTELYDVFQSGGQLNIKGQVACKLWVQPRITINEASKAVKQDIMRSLATRMEMHWDSLTEEENLEDINCVHEPPRRVLISLPNSKISLSDYLFPGEGAQDAKLSLEELLDIRIDGKLEIEDVEGQADIGEFYRCPSENASEEAISRLPTDANKFMYIVGLAVALFVLILSLLVHFLK